MWPFHPCPCSDEEFVKAFQWFVDSTVQIFDEPTDDYETMVVTIRGQRMGFHELSPMEDPSEDVDERDVLRNFGKVLRRRLFKPQLVMAAFLGLTLDDNYLICVTACTLDLRECLAHVHLRRDEQGNLHVVDTETFPFDRDNPIQWKGRQSAREIVLTMLGRGDLS